MGIILWIVRILAVLLALRFILRWVFGRGPRQPAGPPAGSRGEVRGGELVRDPQCGTYVPKARAIVVGSGQGALYFCSDKCREDYARRN